MRKNNLFFLALAAFVFSGISYAETCPRVDEIKSQALAAWKAYDTDDQPLSAQQEALFKKNMVAFTLAEWTNQPSHGGAIHCYYRDKNGSNLEAYLSKNNFVPQKSSRYWYQVTGYMHCAAGMEQCAFEKSPALAMQQRLTKQPHLAEK